MLTWSSLAGLRSCCSGSVTRNQPNEAATGDEVSFIESIFWSTAPDRDRAPSDALALTQCAMSSAIDSFPHSADELVRMRISFGPWRLFNGRLYIPTTMIESEISWLGSGD